MGGRIFIFGGGAIEFAQFGMDPKVINLVVDAYWPTIGPNFLNKCAGADLFLYFHPRLLGRDFPKEVQQGLSSPPGAPYSLTARVLFDLSELGRLGAHPLAQPAPRSFKSRYGMINLSAFRREIDQALARPLPALGS
jgi:hypothetical protein